MTILLDNIVGIQQSLTVAESLAIILTIVIMLLSLVVTILLDNIVGIQQSLTVAESLAVILTIVTYYILQPNDVEKN